MTLLQDVLDKARGRKVCGVYVKVLIYFGLHSFFIAGLLFTDTFLLTAIQGTDHI